MLLAEDTEKSFKLMEVWMVHLALQITLIIKLKNDLAL
jgi:hypothetical protein